MSAGITVESFHTELGRLVEMFGRNFDDCKRPGYDGRSLTQELPAPSVCRAGGGWAMKQVRGAAFTPLQLPQLPWPEICARLVRNSGGEAA